MSDSKRVMSEKPLNAETPVPRPAVLDYPQ